MAKLENVKILDMVNGEPTRVEYNGAVYEKTEEKAKEGDLVRVIDADYICDVIQGGFYKIYDSCGDDLSFDDEDDCERDYDANQRALETFRKVSETKASADLAERLAELERRLEALEGCVGAKEGERQARRLNVGDYARVVANDTMHSANIGDIVKIVEDEHDSQPYRCEDLNGEDVGWFAEHELEPITDEEVRWARIGRKPGEYKAGDLVRFTPAGSDRVHGLLTFPGIIVEIESAFDSYVLLKKPSFVRSYYGTHTLLNEIELVVPVEHRFDIAVEPKEGARQ